MMRYIVAAFVIFSTAIASILFLLIVPFIVAYLGILPLTSDVPGEDYFIPTCCFLIPSLIVAISIAKGATRFRVNVLLISSITVFLVSIIMMLISVAFPIIEWAHLLFSVFGIVLGLLGILFVTRPPFASPLFNILTKHHCAYCKSEYGGGLTECPYCTAPTQT